MKFNLIAFILMLIATHQCAFGIEENVFSMPAVLHKIPGVHHLVDTVEVLSDIKNEIKPHFDDLREIIVTGLKQRPVACKLKNDYLQLNPVGAKETKVGKLIRLISEKLDKGIKVAKQVMANVKQTLGHLIEAGDHFVNNGLGKVKKNEICTTAISEARNNFTDALEVNAKLCIADVSNVISRHIRKLETFQQELNLGIQTGKLRSKIVADIYEQVVTFIIDINPALNKFALCEMDGLHKSFWTFTKYYASNFVSCIHSILGK